MFCKAVDRSLISERKQKWRAEGQKSVSRAAMETVLENKLSGVVVI